MADQNFKIKNGLQVGNGTLAIDASGNVYGTWLGGTISVNRGGTGATSLASGGILYGNNTGAVGVSVGGAGQVLVSSGSSAPAWVDATDAANANTIVERDANARFKAADPVAATDVATKQYVDNLAQGLDVKASVKVATSSSISLNSIQTIDGVNLAAGDRVLVKEQSPATANGIYTVSGGPWTRAADMDTAAKLPGAFVFVEQGAHADTGWVCTNDSTAVLGTTNITFYKFAGVGTYNAGNGLTLTGTTFSVDAGTIDTGTLAVARGGTGVTTSTGSGSVVLSNSPSLTTPTLGVATATSVNKVAITAPATSATLTIANGKTLTANNTLTFTGTDDSSVAFGAGGTVAYTANKLSAFAATTSAELAGVISDETGTGALVFANTPTLVTPVLGTPTSGTLTNCTGLPVSTGISGLGASVATFLATPSSTHLLSAITGETGTGALVFGTSPELSTPALSGETFSTSDPVTAGTNAQGQSALTSDYNVVRTTSTNPSGVTLPTATVGRRVVVINKGANPINVYPASGGTIDALATNAAISIPVNSGMEFNASSTTQWYSSFNYSTSGSMVSGNISGNAANVTGTVAVVNGGTGQSSYAAGDLLYASGSTALSKLAAGTSGQLLVSAGAAAPVWTSTSGMSPTFLSTALTAQYADTSSVQRQLTLNRQTSGTAANGIGAGIAFSIEDAAGATAARSYIDTVLHDVTSGSVDASLVFSTARNNVLTEDMRVGYNGNVGIGTATPSKKLDVAGDAQVSGAFTVDTDTLVVDATNNRVGISTAAPAAKLHITNNAASDTLTTTGGNIKFADNAGVAANGELYFWGGVNSSDRGYFGYWDYDLAPSGASSFFFTPAGKGYLRQGLVLNYLAPTSNEVLIKEGSDWVGSGSYWYFNNSGVFGRIEGSTPKWSISGTGVTTNLSDVRLKSDIAPISYGLAQLKTLTPISYVFTSDATAAKQLGFSAQEVKEVIPEAVSEMAGVLPDGDKPLGMCYTALIPVLVNAIKELSAQVDELKAKMAAHGIE